MIAIVIGYQYKGTLIHHYSIYLNAMQKYEKSFNYLLYPTKYVSLHKD